MSKPRILWSIDALNLNVETLRRSAKLLKVFLKKIPADVEPVCVLSPHQLKVSTDFFIENSHDFRLEAEKQTTKELKKLKVPGLLPLTLLNENDLSLRKSASCLAAYGKKSQAAFILVATEAKKGLDRLFLGSFAESLVGQTQTPILLVNPVTQPTPSIRTVVYATDFTSVSRAAFGQILALAKQLGASIQIYHRVETLSEVAVPAVMTSGAYPGYLEQELERRRREAAQMEEEGKVVGVKVATFFDEKGMRSAAQGVVRFTKTQVSPLVVMASQTGPLMSALLGSVTRQVMRQCQSPVWLLPVWEGEEAQEVPSGGRGKGQTFNRPVPAGHSDILF